MIDSPLTTPTEDVCNRNGSDGYVDGSADAGAGDSTEPATSAEQGPNCEVDDTRNNINNTSDIMNMDTSNKRPNANRRISSSMLLDDCPICLDVMTTVDFDHPLQCEIHCGFNMCRQCIESFIESSKDGYQEASDGSHQLKVWLHCPNCRSDLSHSIRDTLLLRKADEIQCLLRKTQNQKDKNNQRCDVDQSQWTASQVRLYKALDTPEVQSAIQQARKLEDEYLERSHNEGDEECDSDGDEEGENSSFIFDGSVTEAANDDEDDDAKQASVSESSEAFLMAEEWGVEAELDVGVHTSFRMPSPPQPVVREEAIKVDPTLSAGLDYFLSDDQRLEITRLMTSGQPANLAKAAQIMHNVVQEKIKRQSTGPSVPSSSPPPPSSSGRPPHPPAHVEHRIVSERTSNSCKMDPLNGSKKDNHSRPPLGRRLSSTASAGCRSPHHRKRSLARRSSVFDLIEESNQAHLKHQQRLNGGDVGTKGANHDPEEKRVAEETIQMLAMINGTTLGSPRFGGAGGQSRIAQHRAMEREIQLQADFQKRFPLPVRMPKAIDIDLSLPIDMEFIDYTWGGTVMDAYSKITIGFRNHVTQRRPDNAQVRMILGQDTDATGMTVSSALGCAFALCASLDEDDDSSQTNDVHIAFSEARVLISHAGRSGQNGAMRGDVVTHIDGECLAGMSAGAVLQMLLYEQDTIFSGNNETTAKTVMMTLNAEKSVAEALKRRAMAIAEM